MALALGAGTLGCGNLLWGAPVADRAGPSPDPTAGPWTAEDRAETFVDTLATDCEREGAGCVDRGRRLRYPVPDAQIPSSTRYFVTSQPQEVSSLGFEIRFDPGTDRYEVDRGNTLAYPSNRDPDQTVQTRD